MMRPLTVLTLIALATGLAQAHAQQSGAADTAAGDFPDAAPMTETDLDTARGGQGVYLDSTQVLNATSVGNSVNANEVGSGSIELDDNALSNFNGVANVVVNTGHNNTLQGSVSVNVIYDPASAAPPATTP